MEKILFVSNQLSHIKAFHLPYLKWFKDRGYEVHVMTNAHGEGLDECDVLYDLNIVRSPFSAKNIAVIRDAEKIITRENYKIVHCHTPMGGIIGRLASAKIRKKGAKVIYTAHGFHFYKGAPLINRTIYYIAEKLLVRKTDCIITINNEDFDVAKRKFESAKTKVEKVNGVGIDLQKFNAPDEAEKNELKKAYGYEGNFLLIYAAEFIARKNHKFLIDAVENISLRCPNVKILFCGKGSQFEKMKTYAKKMGVEKYVDFLGFRKDMPELYNISDILISASFQEGLATNVIEGMSAGLPAVISDVRGHSDIVTNGKDGYLFKLNDPSKFCDNIYELYSSRELYNAFSEHAKKKAMEFAVGKSLTQMDSIYKKYL